MLYEGNGYYVHMVVVPLKKALKQMGQARRLTKTNMIHAFMHGHTQLSSSR